MRSPRWVALRVGTVVDHTNIRGIVEEVAASCSFFSCSLAWGEVVCGSLHVVKSWVSSLWVVQLRGEFRKMRNLFETQNMGYSFTTLPYSLVVLVYGLLTISNLRRLLMPSTLAKIALPWNDFFEWWLPSQWRVLLHLWDVRVCLRLEGWLTSP